MVNFKGKYFKFYKGQELQFYKAYVGYNIDLETTLLMIIVRIIIEIIFSGYAYMVGTVAKINSILL